MTEQDGPGIKPLVATDVACVQFRGNRLHVLLIRRKNPPFQGNWAFPGGFVEENESLRTAAERELREETGVTGSGLQQFYTAGDPGRDPRGRVITICFCALLPPGPVQLCAETDASEARWFPVQEPPSLAFDHHQVLSKLQKHLKEQFLVGLDAFDLLPEPFELGELYALLGDVYEEGVSKSSFEEQVNALPYLKLDQTTDGGMQKYTVQEEGEGMGPGICFWNRGVATLQNDPN